MKKVVGEILRPFAIIRTICTLDRLTVGAFAENYEQDKNGRSVKITKTLGGQNVYKTFWILQARRPCDQPREYYIL